MTWRLTALLLTYCPALPDCTALSSYYECCIHYIIYHYVASYRIVLHHTTCHPYHIESSLDHCRQLFFILCPFSISISRSITSPSTPLSTTIPALHYITFPSLHTVRAGLLTHVRELGTYRPHFRRTSHRGQYSL